MKIKYFLITAVLVVTILCSAGFVSAQTTQTQASLTQQLIQLLTQMITQLEQEIQQILAQQHISAPTNCIPAGGAYAAPLTSSDLCCSGLIEQPTTQSGTVGICVLPSTQSSITVTLPAGGEAWNIGETHNITWSPGLVYDAGCHNFISLQDTNGKTIGIISNGLLSKGQTSFSWNTKDMYNLSCGSGASNVAIAPGTYRIAVIEQGDGSASMPDINSYSNYFSIGSPASTLNWQTVSEFGFSIKYPNDWTRSDDVMSVGLSKKIGSGSLGNGSPFNNCSLNIATIGGRNTVTDFNNFIQQNYGTWPQPEQQVNVNGISATKITNCNQNGCWTNYWIFGGAGKYSFQITTQTQTTTITQSSGVNVGMSSYVDIPECDNTFSQMLSTFTTTD